MCLIWDFILSEIEINEMNVKYLSSVYGNMFIQINNRDYSAPVLGTVCARTVHTDEEQYRKNPQICDMDWKVELCLEEGAPAE